MKSASYAWLLFAAAAVVAALVTGGILAWNRKESAREVAARLPPRPALDGQQAILRERLVKAEAMTKSPAHFSAGVEELGRLYHANNFPAQAAACWKLLRTVEPAEARWCYYLADLSRSTSDYDGMTAFLQETLRLDPGYTPARLQLANLQFKSGDRGEAARNYQLRLAALPHDPYARLGLVRLALQDGRQDEARTLLERILQDTPHFSTAHNLYAEMLAAAGNVARASQHRWLGRETLRYREAEDPWLDEMNRWCYNYERLCTLATIESQANNRDQAKGLFERAIRLKPDEPQAYALLAALHLRDNNAAGAVELLEQARPRLGGGTSATFFITLSQAYRILHQPGLAVKAAQGGLDGAGETPELLDALGLALADSGRHEEALAAWAAALGKNPGDASANYNRALSLLALRRLDEALEALDHSLTLQPTFLPTLLLRGEIELEAGHWELAEKYLRPAFASHPENPQARRLLAEWHLRRGSVAAAAGDAQTAEQNFRAGLLIDDTHPGLLTALGVSYLSRSKASEAIPLLAASHRLLPENARVCLLLGQAYSATGDRDRSRAILLTGARLAEQAGDRRTAELCRLEMSR